MAYDSESLLATAIERLNDKMDKIDDKVDGVQKDVNKFVVLFEKLAHIEKDHNDSNKRVHHRITEIATRVDKLENIHTNGEGCATFRTFLAAHNEEQKNTNEKIKSFGTFKKAIEDKPAARIEGWINVVMSVIITSLVVYFLTKAGVK